MPVRSTPSPARLAMGSRAPSSRDGGAGEGPATLVGYFAVFNSWTEIDSIYEGHFMERFAPGAFAASIARDRDRIRVLFQHGRDPQIGDKPLGPIDVLEEDAIGARYEVPLLDTAYTAELAPGLAASVYGASFRFRTIREEFNSDPGTSEHNPAGIPERTVIEAKLIEFGPVTFPAYQAASAGLRSLTDWHHDPTARGWGVRENRPQAGHGPPLSFPSPRSERPQGEAL